MAGPGRAPPCRADRPVPGPSRRVRQTTECKRRPQPPKHSGNIQTVMLTSRNAPPTENAMTAVDERIPAGTGKPQLQLRTTNSHHRPNIRTTLRGICDDKRPARPSRRDWHCRHHGCPTSNPNERPKTRRPTARGAYPATLSQREAAKNMPSLLLVYFSAGVRTARFAAPAAQETASFCLLIGQNGALRGHLPPAEGSNGAAQNAMISSRRPAHPSGADAD